MKSFAILILMLLNKRFINFLVSVEKLSEILFYKLKRECVHIFVFVMQKRILTIRKFRFSGEKKSAEFFRQRRRDVETVSRAQ